MIIVVTGGIGSGKSQVCGILSARYGFHIYEADTRVKDLYRLHPALLDTIEKALGTELRDGNGEFIPSRLAKIIFSCPKALSEVESLVFPVLMEDFDSWVRSLDDTAHVVFESATILEKPQFSDFGDIVVLVDAPVDVRRARALQRDGDIVSVNSRINAQSLMNNLSDGGSDQRIDHVIDNSGDLINLQNEISRFINDFVL